jgi:hypothetical protein
MINVVFGFKIISHRNPDNNLESLCRSMISVVVSGFKIISHRNPDNNLE